MNAARSNSFGLGVKRLHAKSSSKARGRGLSRELGRGHASVAAATGSTSAADFTQVEHAGPDPKPKLTHFISLPLGHHPGLRSSISTFTTALLRTQPPITGLDDSIVINPHRLHLTLGVMSLDETSLTEVLALLTSLKPSIENILGGSQLRISLGHLHIMPPERGDSTRAHVMWAGPDLQAEDNHGDNARLSAVSNLIHEVFRDKGFTVDEKRPLKLHCTLVNTTYRRPRTKGRRLPFSYKAVLESSALRSIATDIESMEADLRGKKPVSVDLGAWNISEVQVCLMGSHGPEDEYVSCGGISLGPG